MKRFVTPTLALLLGAVSLVALPAAPAQAAPNSAWLGVVSVRNVDSPADVQVIEDNAIYRMVTTSHRQWDINMSWTPVPTETPPEGGFDPFNVVMTAEATGSVFYNEWTQTHFTYKPEVCAQNCSYTCKSETTTRWSGTTRADGPILPTKIAVSGAQEGENFHTQVRASMSIGSGVSTTVTGSGTFIDGGPCPGDGTSASDGPWHDSVTLDFFTPDPPAHLQDSTIDVRAQSFISPDESAVAAIDLRHDTGTIAVGARSTNGDPAPPTFSYTGDIVAERVADGTTTPPVIKTPGTYTVTQQPLPGWSVVDGSCTDPTADSTINLATATATYRVADDEAVACMFVVAPAGEGTLRGAYSYLQTGSPKLTFLNGSQRGELDVPVGTNVSGIELHSVLKVTLEKHKDSVGLVFNGLLGDGTAFQPCLGTAEECAGHVRWTYVDNEVSSNGKGTTFIYHGERTCTGAVTTCLGTIAVRLHPLDSGIITGVGYAASATAVVNQRTRGPLPIEALPLESKKVFSGTSQLRFPLW